MKRFLTLIFLISFALAVPILEIDVDDKITMPMGKVSSFTVRVENTGDSIAKNVTLSIDSLWGSSRNEIFPLVPSHIEAGKYKNFTIWIKPPYEGDYPVTLTAQSVQKVSDEKIVIISVPLADKPLEVESIISETDSDDTSEPDKTPTDNTSTTSSQNTTQENFTTDLERIELQIKILKSGASPTASILLDRAAAAAASAKLAYTQGETEIALSSKERAKTLLSQALEQTSTGGIDEGSFYTILIVFILSVLYVFKMELTGQEPLYHWKKLFKLVKRKISR